MGTFGIWHWLVVLVVILVIFGAGKLPNVMGDMAKGVKAFKKGLADESTPTAQTTPADAVVKDKDPVKPA